MESMGSIGSVVLAILGLWVVHKLSGDLPKGPAWGRLFRPKRPGSGLHRGMDML